jgi:hypothetical protein
MPETKWHVVHCLTREQDGTEESASIVGSLAAALALVNQWGGGPERVNAHNSVYRVFELGKEVPIKREVVEEPQPAKRSINYRAAKGGN